MRDKVIDSLISEEYNRQMSHIELIASENYVSKDVLTALGSCLTNKYAEGYPGRRYYGGCENIDLIEQIAIDRAKALFNVKYVNVQPHSGTQANTAVYFALLKPGDRVMGMDLNAGGHLSHGSPVNISGKYFTFIPYGVNENGYLDYNEIRQIAKECKPRLIIAGASAYPRKIDFAAFRSIAKEVGAYLMTDIAHIAGLVATDMHPSPVGLADVVTTTTHKTLRGPRGGMIMTNDENIAKKINSAIFPGIQGGPLENTIAAKAVCFGEALQPQFTEYQKAIIRNANELAKCLKDCGFNLVTDGTDNHLIVIDLKDSDVTGKELETRLNNIGITVNKESVPGDNRPPTITSGIRVGTPAITTLGFVEKDMKTIAEFIKLAYENRLEGNNLKSYVNDFVNQVIERGTYNAFYS